MSNWTALIQTSTGILQRVNFTSASSWRQDAIAQAEGTYGGKVITCNLAGNTIKSSKSSTLSNVASVAGAATTTLSDLILMPVVILLLIFATANIQLFLTVTFVSGAIYLFRKLRR